MTIKESTLNIVSYINYSENYINAENNNYNNYLFFNYKEMVMDNLKKYLLNMLVMEDFINMINNQNMEDVRCILTQETLNNLPVSQYSEMNGDLKSINNYCSICRDVYNVDTNKELRILKCNHAFCCECIDPWLLNHSHKCPNCRVEMDGHTHI